MSCDSSCRFAIPHSTLMRSGNPLELDRSKVSHQIESIADLHYALADSACRFSHVNVVECSYRIHYSKQGTSAERMELSKGKEIESISIFAQVRCMQSRKNGVPRTIGDWGMVYPV